MTTETLNADELASALVSGIATQLSMIVDREFRVDELRVERASARPAGAGQVHVSFRFAFTKGATELHGCVLLPLPDAISLANYLLMASDEAVAERRGADDLDRTTKEAMIEVANFMAGAVSGVVRDHEELGYGVRTEGCQGVRADVRPALDYDEGSDLIVVRANAQIHDWPGFELIAILPPFDPAA